MTKVIDQYTSDPPLLHEALNEQDMELEALRKQNLEQASRIKELELSAMPPTILSASARHFRQIENTVTEQAAQIEMMRNELLLMTRDKWHWQEARDRALSTTPSQAKEIAELRAEIERCNKHFKTINDTIFCEGLALGSEKYFLIRGLCCQYLTSKTLNEGDTKVLKNDLTDP